MKIRTLIRSVEEVPVNLWARKVEFEHKYDEASAKAGLPAPRRYRPMFGPEHANVRITQYVYDSETEWGRLMENWYKTDEYHRLEAERRSYVNWERQEKYYVDSGSPAVPWMKHVSDTEMSDDILNCACLDYGKKETTQADIDLVQKNAAEGKIRIMYRIVQHIPFRHWAEKLEQERRCDLLEEELGWPLPLRLRAAQGLEDSHIRINEREIASLEELCALNERYTSDDEAQKLEITRTKLFTWEREEMYWVDSDIPMPKWMEYAENQK